MSRNLVRRGATLLVGAALLGGVLALGGGTASADEIDTPEEVAGSVVGFVPDTISGLVIWAGFETGSIDKGDIFPGCAPVDCPPAPPTGTQLLLAYLQGHGNGPFPAVPWAPAIPWAPSM